VFVFITRMLAEGSAALYEMSAHFLAPSTVRLVHEPMRISRVSGFANFLVGVGLVLVLAGCRTTPSLEVDSPAPAPVDLASHEWVLAELDGDRLSLAPPVRPTVRFNAESKRITGFGGVNRINGTYSLNGTNLKFGPILATKMAGPPEQNEVETTLLRSLESVTGWRITRDQLELLANNQVVARFEPLRE
jgi:heat shock protein HslJ